MNIIALDIEHIAKTSRKEIPDEIIELGAVKISNNEIITEFFHSYIKPKFLDQHNFYLTTKITGITRDYLSDGLFFKEAIQNFIEWCNFNTNVPTYFLTWSDDDFFYLKRDCEINELETSWLKNFIDVQGIFSNLLNLNDTVNLIKAAAMLNLNYRGHEHNALDDALITALIYQKIELDYRLKVGDLVNVDGHKKISNKKLKNAINSKIYLMGKMNIPLTWENFKINFDRKKYGDLEEDIYKNLFEKALLKRRNKMESQDKINI